MKEEGKGCLLGIFFTNREALKLGTTVRIYQRERHKEAFKDDVFSEEMHSLKAQKTFYPPVCLSKNS